MYLMVKPMERVPEGVSEGIVAPKKGAEEVEGVHWVVGEVPGVGWGAAPTAPTSPAEPLLAEPVIHCSLFLVTRYIYR